MVKLLLDKSEIRIYGAGKTWAAHALKELRDIHGFNIVSRWIDIPNVLVSPDDEFDYDNQDFKYLEKMWDKGCKIDATIACDLAMVIALPEDGEKHSGSLVEIGHTSASFVYTGVQKPVYLVGSCLSFEKVGHSDRGFTHQRTFHRIPVKDNDVLSAANQVIAHYSANYANDWLKWRKFIKKNAFIAEMERYCREGNSTIPLPAPRKKAS